MNRLEKRVRLEILGKSLASARLKQKLFANTVW